MIVISESAAATLFTAQRLVLCEQSLLDLFIAAVKTDAVVVPYDGFVVGSNTKAPPAFSLNEFGIPVGLEMIVAPEGCETARELRALCKSSGFPREVSFLEVQLSQAGTTEECGLKILSAYQQAIEMMVSELRFYVRNREEEVASLRRRVETQTLINNHLSDFISMLGYNSQEFALERVPDREVDFLHTPIQQQLPTVLSDIAGISIYSAPTTGPQTARLKIGTQYSEIFEQDINLPTGGGWNDLFFPEGFLSSNHDAELTLDAVQGEPTFAVAKGRASDSSDMRSSPGSSIAMRIWRHPSPNIHPVRSELLVHFPRPIDIQRNVIGQDAILAASGVSHIEALISLPDQCFVQTHPVAGEIANYCVRDIDIRCIQSVQALAYLAHQDASSVKFILCLMPQADDDRIYDSLKKLVAGQQDIGNMSFADAVLSQGQSGSLELSTEGLDRELKYTIVLATEALEEPSYAWAQWRNVSIKMMTKPFLQTYRFSYLAALQQQIEYADGPIIEHELNSQNGYAVISVSDGDRYLQTNPLVDTVVAARLNFFAPKGLLRFWIDTSIDHEGASPTEFGVLIIPEIIGSSFSAHYKSSGFDKLADEHLHSLPNGGYLKKTVLNPLDKKTIELCFARPLEEGSHVHLYVKTRSGGTQYGWCRWHRLAMTILAESSSQGIGEGDQGRAPTGTLDKLRSH